MFLIHRPLDAANRISRFLDEAFRTWPVGGDGSLVGTWMPPVDILEEADSVRIMAELPGVRPENVKISVEGNVLTIRGEKQQTAETRTERVHRYERTYGTFERSFTVPESVDIERISASYENGVLTVTLPKVERARPREITVQVAQN